MKAVSNNALGIHRARGGRTMDDPVLVRVTLYVIIQDGGPDIAPYR